MHRATCEWPTTTSRAAQLRKRNDNAVVADTTRRRSTRAGSGCVDRRVIRDLGETGSAIHQRGAVGADRCRRGIALGWRRCPVRGGSASTRFRRARSACRRRHWSRGRTRVSQEVYDDARHARVGLHSAGDLAGLPILLAGGEARTGIDLRAGPDGVAAGLRRRGDGPLANDDRHRLFAWRTSSSWVPSTCTLERNDRRRWLLHHHHRCRNHAATGLAHQQDALGYPRRGLRGAGVRRQLSAADRVRVPLGFDVDATDFDFQLQPGPRLRDALRDAITLRACPTYACNCSSSGARCASRTRYA